MPSSPHRPRAVFLDAHPPPAVSTAAIVPTRTLRSRHLRPSATLASERAPTARASGDARRAPQSRSSRARRALDEPRRRLAASDGIRAARVDEHAAARNVRHLERPPRLDRRSSASQPAHETMSTDL
ncbi:hypothetical protein PsYK624_097460 [Phanerochaete sordida]|uniref:Uncharacterized protein n=1 Tax=Phanerochaete sordida TaxID=48140 RepID=A0A9P3GF24_9APHY|nr:hypothetical protein PsYK624_097460 [Phanerochaete sordida]